MNEKQTIHKMKFEHFYQEGTHYEIGKKQGEIIKKYNKSVKWYTTGKFNREKSKFSDFKEVYEFYDKMCPGLSDEAQGFAESLDVKVDQLVIYDFPASMQNNCSQMLILPSLTKNGHIIAGRSYEWNFEEDLQLRTTKVNGKFKHIGFSGMVYGRYEGLNEKGLCVTASSGGAWSAPQENKGINWALAVRVLLENCRNTEDALKTLENIPVEGTNSFIISDKSGKAVLLESLDARYAIRTIDEKTMNQYIIATNHYNLPSKTEFNKYNNPWLLPNSKKRYEIIETSIKENENKIDEETVKNILSTEFPEGICCHWYTDFFGTLWSVLINVTDEKVMVCFGPPTHNKWHEFSFNDTAITTEYEAIFPDKRIQI